MAKNITYIGLATNLIKNNDIYIYITYIVCFYRSFETNIIIESRAPNKAGHSWDLNSPFCSPKTGQCSAWCQSSQLTNQKCKSDKSLLSDSTDLHRPTPARDCRPAAARRLLSRAPASPHQRHLPTVTSLLARHRGSRRSSLTWARAREWEKGVGVACGARQVDAGCPGDLQRANYSRCYTVIKVIDDLKISNADPTSSQA